MRQHPAIDDRIERRRTGRAEVEGGGEQGIRIEGAKVRCRAWANSVHSQRVSEAERDGSRVVSRSDAGADPGTALQNRALKKSFRQWRRDERADAESSGRFAEDRHARRIATEAGDVALHPLQCGDLVEEPVVPGGVVW